MFVGLNFDHLLITENDPGWYYAVIAAQCKMP